MAHPQQQKFCESIKARFPQFFSGTMALDIGSLDINGNNQCLFDVESLYLGIDVAQGRNVDVVYPAHVLGLPDATFDTVISTECLEHDRHWVQTLHNAIRMLRPGGLLLITCATTGRPEHGTRRTTPHDAPLLASVDDEWADYYRNLGEDDIRTAIDVPGSFQFSEFSIGAETHDLYFFAIKHGVFEKRLNRSTQIESQPWKILEAELRMQVRRDFEQITSLNLASIDHQTAYRCHVGQLASAIGQRDGQIAILTSEVDALKTSTSWKVTAPIRFAGHQVRRIRPLLRVFMMQAGKAGAITRRARNALRYVARGDFNGLRNRLSSIQSDHALQNFSVMGPPKRWGVMTTHHTLFVAHLVASRLRAQGWEADIMTKAPSGFPHDMYVVTCPQMFKDLPSGDKRIIYQMEQSVSSRWFTDKYFKTLEGSLAVLEYSLVNIKFMSDKGIAYPHVHYLPVGSDASYMGHIPPTEKTCDVLFYGDANSSSRRRKMLDTLRQHFDVRVCSEIFGLDMIKQIRCARVVINLHYYENALLEMPRIQECLSLGVPVVSEAAQDQADYPEIFGAVTFFDQGNEQAMIDAVRSALEQSVEPETLYHAAALGSERFAFMFDRFLVAMGLLPAAKLADDGLPLPHDATRIALSMPETIARRRIFEANRPQNCAVFDGVRLRPGWVGCGLSYASLARHALKHGIGRLTVLEDDVLLPDKFEEKMRIVQDYLDTKDGQWDAFAGVIAVLHPDVKILNVETFQGMRFVTVDKMTSLVCNIYSEKALRILASWDPDHRDDQTNTIDKYLERQASLRVVVALPFLVGHREEVHSTLWGFQNTQYSDLIAASEKALHAMV